MGPLEQVATVNFLELTGDGGARHSEAVIFFDDLMMSGLMNDVLSVTGLFLVIASTRTRRSSSQAFPGTLN